MIIGRSLQPFKRLFVDRSCIAVWHKAYSSSAPDVTCLQDAQSSKQKHDKSGTRQSNGWQLELEEKEVGLTKDAQRKLSSRRPAYSPEQRLLKVAIIGAPNAGKSTLLNKLVGWKVAPVSQKVHTTRYKTLGVLTEDDKQVVFLDTPGIIVPGKMKRHNLELSLLVDPHIALTEADLIVVTVDVSHVWHRSRLDPEILKLLHLHADVTSVLVLNKVDLIEPKHRLLDVVRKLTRGVVSDQQHWSTIKAANKRVDLNALFAKSRVAAKITEEVAETEACQRSGGCKSLPLPPLSDDVRNLEYLDVKEVCRSLQNSEDFDDNILVNDDHGTAIASKSTKNSVVTDVLSIDHRNVDAAACSEPLNDDGLTAAAELSTRAEGQDRDVTNDGNEGGTGNFTGELNLLSSPPPFNPGHVGNLYTASTWADYYGRLEKIGRGLKNEEGWPHFDAVFMVSALGGDGVFDLKNYLLDRTYRSPWLYASSLVTNQDPVKLAKLIIRERLLDNLPQEIPYCVQVKLALWEVGEDNLLRSAFDIVCSEPRHLHRILGKDGETVRRIAAEAKQQLMNAFRREMTLKLVVHGTRSLRLAQTVSTARSRKNTAQTTDNIAKDLIHQKSM